MWLFSLRIDQAIDDPVIQVVTHIGRHKQQLYPDVGVCLPGHYAYGVDVATTRQVELDPHGQAQVNVFRQFNLEERSARIVVERHHLR